MPPQRHKPFSVVLREPSAAEKCGYVERRWRVTRARLPQNQHQRNWGTCCHHRRRIAIHTPLSDEAFWSTLWHEVDHATHPYLDEGPILMGEFNRLEVSRAAGLFVEDDD
jgi:hypothetical protein